MTGNTLASRGRSKDTEDQTGYRLSDISSNSEALIAGADCWYSCPGLAMVQDGAENSTEGDGTSTSRERPQGVVCSVQATSEDTES